MGVMGLGYSYIHDAVTDGNELDSRKRLREEVGEVIGLGYVGHPLDTADLVILLRFTCCTCTCGYYRFRFTVEVDLFKYGFSQYWLVLPRVQLRVRPGAGSPRTS